MNSNNEINTERLILRPTNYDDVEFIIELLNTPKWLKYIGDRNVRTTKDAKEYIKTKILSQFDRLGYGNYTVIRKSDNKKVGTCGIYDREGLEGVDIGFGFLPEFEKQGYAFESSNKLLQVAINDFKIKLINAITLPSNKPSQKLLEKLGLKFVRVFCLPNDEDELMLYQIKC